MRSQKGLTVPAPAGWRPGLAPWKTLAVSEPGVSAEELFGELDGACVTGAGSTWHIRVFSVLDDIEGRWLQLGLNGPRDEWATLRVPTGGGATYVNLALHAWFHEHRIGDLA